MKGGDAEREKLSKVKEKRLSRGWRTWGKKETLNKKTGKGSELNRKN